MHSSAPPDSCGTSRNNPEPSSFAEALDRHLKNGTRPDGQPDRPGKRWGIKEFAGAVGVSDRAVRKWLSGESDRVNDFASIEKALFGDNPAYDAARIALRQAYDGEAPIAEPTPCASPPTKRIPIPRPTAHFLGRDEIVTALRDALLASSEGAAILVQGGPGIGKTALTQAIGNHSDVVARFGECRWFVALENAPSTETLCDAVLGALGLEPKDGFGAALQRLGAAPGLIVLDNLETPWDPRAERRATEATLADLAAIPGLTLLASFRGSDFVDGPDWQVEEIHGLDAGDAATLFRHYAKRIAPDDPDLPRFIAALGGIPLAIELVARQAYSRTTLAALWMRWTEIGAELATDPDYEAARLTSLPHSIELSLRSQRLTDEARRLFRLLGHLPAGLCAEDRDALLGRSGDTAENALIRIGLAIERDTRLDMLPPIRDHAKRHHRPESPDGTAWPAHFLTLTRERGEAIGTKAGVGAVARLTPEYPNVDAAIRAVIEGGRRHEAMAALHGFYRFTSIASLSAPVLSELGVTCREDGDLHGEALCIEHSGDIALARFDHEVAKSAYEKAIPLYRLVGDVRSEAHCIKDIGRIALVRSDHDSARAAFESALPLYRQVGSLLGEANCIQNLGNIALACSDHEAARAAIETALPLHRQIGDLLGEANCILSLGEIALARSDHEAARDAFETALPLFRQIGDLLGEANCIKSRGNIALARSDHEAAREAYETALPLYRRIGDRDSERECQGKLDKLAVG